MKIHVDLNLKFNSYANLILIGFSLTVNSHLLTLKAHNHNMYDLLSSTKIFATSYTNSVDQDFFK